MGHGDRRITRRISWFHICSHETLSQTRTDKWGCHCGWWTCALTYEDTHVHMCAHTHTHCVQCTSCLIFMHLYCLSCYTLSFHSKAMHRDVRKYLMFYNCSDLLHVLGHDHVEEDSMNSWENVHSTAHILLSSLLSVCLSALFSLPLLPVALSLFTFYLKKELWFLEITSNFFVRANNLHRLLYLPWIVNGYKPLISNLWDSYKEHILAIISSIKKGS